MSYHQLLYHIVFRTKYSQPSINETYREELYRYIWGIINKTNSHLYRIGGIDNHVHILVEINPTIAIADFMRDIKSKSSLWAKENLHFPKFSGWSEGYGVVTHNYKDKDIIIEYIKNQKEHHKKTTFQEEYRKFLEDNHIEINEQYFLR